MITEILKEIELGSTNFDKTELTSYQCLCLYEYVKTLCELVDKQSEVIKKLSLSRKGGTNDK